MKKTLQELIDSKCQIGNVYTPAQLREMVLEEPTPEMFKELYHSHRHLMLRFEMDGREAYFRTLLNMEALLKALFDYKPIVTARG